VGGVVGGLAVLGIVIVAIYWIRRKHPKARAIAETQDSYVNASNAEMMYTRHEMPGQHEAQELEGRWNQRVELPVVWR
jgi:hypothetical protein